VSTLNTGSRSDGMAKCAIYVDALEQAASSYAKVKEREDDDGES